MKKLGIVAVVMLILGALSVWYMAVLPLRHEFEASEELVDDLRGKLEVSQAEASRLKEENFVLSQTVTTLEASRRSLEEKEAVELHYWQAKYGSVVEELRDDAKAQIASMERTEANFLVAMADLEQCEASLSDANTRIGDLADSMGDMEGECTLALEYASAETRDCFELLEGVRHEADERNQEKNRLAVQVGELEYEMASLARALDRQQYLLYEAEKSEENAWPTAEEQAQHFADEVAYEADTYEEAEEEEHSNFLEGLFEEESQGDFLLPAEQYQEGLGLQEEYENQQAERLWHDIGEEEEEEDRDWYPQSSAPYDKVELALEHYKAQYEQMRKQKEEEIFRNALGADDYDWEDYDSDSDDYPLGDDTWANVGGQEREEEWWDDLELDSALVYDDDNNDDYDDDFDVAFNDDDDYYMDDRAADAADDLYYDDDEELGGFFDPLGASGMRNNADRELDAWELERQVEEDRRWEMAGLDSFSDFEFEDSFSFDAEILRDDDDDEEDYYLDDDDLLPFDAYDDDGYGEEELVDFLAQQDFYDDDEEY